MNGNVMIAVDPHKASNTAAVLDPVTKTVIEAARFANSQEGYERLAGFAGDGNSAAGRWRAATGRAGRWRSGWWLTASTCWMCRRSWPPGYVCTPRAMAARPTGTTPSRSGWPPWTAPASPKSPRMMRW
jgi:hypothetical protein